MFDIDVKGALSIKRCYPYAILIFIKVPSLEELQRRLRGRKSENLVQIKKRLERLPKEMSYANKYDVQIVNRYFKETVKKVNKTIQNTLKELEVDVR